MEIWKEVKGYEDYEVSNLGRVKSLARTIIYKDGRTRKCEEKILKLNLTGLKGSQYLAVNLCNNGKGKKARIHQLVAEAFLGHKPNGHKLVVDHINNVKTDNRLKNLQLITNRKNSSKDRKNGTSRHIGVYWNKRDKSFISRIQINGKNKGLGYFKNEEEAAKAYQNALAKLVK